jgi:hypothetical protein
MGDAGITDNGRVSAVFRSIAILAVFQGRMERELAAVGGDLKELAEEREPEM